MFEIEGKFTKAKIYASIIEDEAKSQILNLCNQSWTEGLDISVMADVHSGKGCTIGTAMLIEDKVCPNLVGVDIGCGMKVIELGKIDIDLAKLDEVIHKYIPAGKNVHEEVFYHLDILKHIKAPLKDKDYLNRSLGTLGGGNHFIEIDIDGEGNKYLVIHSGSRHLGVEVAKYWMDVAKKSNNKNEVKDIITKLKLDGREKDIEKELKKFKDKFADDELAAVKGEDFEGYINDMLFCQMYAYFNRDLIGRIICVNMGWDYKKSWETIHNYIDTENNILRKGAISAYKDQLCLISMNMRDGSLICIGKGNEDYLCTAPHGAGRLMSRKKAKEELSLDKFKETMSDIYSTTVCEETLDEAPMAYKPMETILEDIKDTVDVVNIIKPIYNFKARE